MMLRQTTFEDMCNVTSSLASAGGRTPCNLPAIPTMQKSGLVHAHASRGAMLTSGRVAAKENTTIGTCGRNGTGSSASANLQELLASRCREQLVKDGSTSFSVTLNQKDTPAGRLYCELVTSEQFTDANGSTLEPTPAARDGRDISRSNAFLSQRRRHSPSMATRWLEQGRPWQAIIGLYCTSMGFPLQWLDVASKALAMPSCRKQPRRSSKRSSKRSDES